MLTGLVTRYQRVLLAAVDQLERVGVLLVNERFPLLLTLKRKKRIALSLFKKAILDQLNITDKSSALGFSPTIFATLRNH